MTDPAADALRAFQAAQSDSRPYLRPIGIVFGGAATGAVAAGTALPLCGGPSAFLAVELIVRDGPGRRMTAVPVAAAREIEGLRDGLEALSRPRPPIRGCTARKFPLVMGVVNVTPDSFSDGGRYAFADAAVAHAEALLEAGADIIDIGGESTRPRATPVPPEVEAERVVPVIRRLAPRVAAAGAIISIDTRNAATAAAAVEAGAAMINDVSALGHDPGSLAVARRSGLPVILMHARGTPETMQDDPRYDDAVLDIHDWFERRLADCAAAGLDRSRLIVDVGIGFGKTVAHNMALLSALALFHGFGLPLAVGVSRKAFIGTLSRREGPGERLSGSLAAALDAARQGARILRVHDVAETRQALAVQTAILNGG